MQISYSDTIPEKYLPIIKEMVEFVVDRLRLDATWESLHVSCSSKINTDGLIWVQWEIHHAHIKLNTGVLAIQQEIYRVLLHEFAHMVTWPWAEAIDHAVSHITDKGRRRAAKLLLNRDYERVNNEIARNLLNILPWKGSTHEEAGGSAVVGRAERQGSSGSGEEDPAAGAQAGREGAAGD